MLLAVLLLLLQSQPVPACVQCDVRTRDEYARRLQMWQVEHMEEESLKAQEQERQKMLADARRCFLAIQDLRDASDKAAILGPYINDSAVTRRLKKAVSAYRRSCP